MALKLSHPTNFPSDTEIIQFLLDIVVYCLEPELQETTSVGGVFQGLDKDPNRLKGWYSVNGQTFEVQRYQDNIKIWKGDKTVPPGGLIDWGKATLIHECTTVDWPRIQRALVMLRVYDEYFQGKENADSQPDLRDNYCEYLLNDMEYMGLSKLLLSSQLDGRDANSALESENTP